MYDLLAMLQYVTDDHHPLHNIYALILPLIWGQQQLLDCELEHFLSVFLIAPLLIRDRGCLLNSCLR